MKVVLNIDPVKFPLTGIGRYTYELALALQDNAQIGTLRLLSGAGFRPALPKAGESAGASYSLKRKVQQSRLVSELYRVISPWTKTWALRGCKDYLYHGPNFYLPPFAGRQVATFHDLSIFTWPQCHTPERVRYMRKELALTLRRADALITDSEFTRQELANYFSWPLERIHAVPLAASADFFPRSYPLLQPELTALGLQAGGYTLFTGSIEPRKNVESLILAYETLPPTIRQHWPLVLSGYQGWENAAIHKRIERGQREGWLRYLGFVPAEKLPLLFAGARLFAFPSLYEGFGLPVLEAMTSGVPVVCSNAASLPEVVGDAALMHEAKDVDALASILLRALQDEEWRSNATVAGLAQAAKFSWARCAAETTAVYRTILDA